MTIKLQSLVSELDLDTKGFELGGKIALGVTAAITAAVASVVVGVKHAVDATVEWADELDGLQDVTNLTNDEVAGLNYALRKHGVDAKQAASALTIFNKGLLETDGKLGKTGKSLKGFGVNVFDTNGKLKSNASLMQEIANKYASLPAGAERAAFATDVFGRSGAELNDVLLDLADNGLSNFIKKAQELGLNLNADDIQKYKQSSEELKMSMDAIWISLGQKAIPVLETVQQQFARLIDSPKFQAVVDEVLTKVGEFGSYLITNIPIWVGKFSDFVGSVEKYYHNTFVPAVNDGKLALAEFTTKVDLLRDAEEKGKDVNPEYAKSFNDLAAIGFSNASEAASSLWGIIEKGVTILGLLTGETDKNAIKVSILQGTLMAIIAPVLQFSKTIHDVGSVLKWVDDRLQDVINHWEQLKQLAEHFSPFKTVSESLPSSSGGGGASSKRRASGGSVIAGQTYQVAEFWKPEMFTPNVSGRVDAMKPASIDENKLGDAIGRRLIRDLPPLLQLLKA